MSTKGYFTIAQGRQYQKMAYALGLSLKISQPEEFSKLSIGVTKDELSSIDPKYYQVFDSVIEIPWEDHAKNSSWKLENEWKAIHMSPYYETIKLDADMLFPTDVSHWWEYLSKSEGVFCTEPKTYRGENITSDFYRRTFTENNLPNIYTALFYFKKTEINFELFELAEDIFNNWERYFYEMLEVEHRPKIVSTDVVFALAAKILDYGQHNKTPNLDFFNFVHMKTKLQNWGHDETLQENWTEFVPNHFSKNADISIANFKQVLPLHYYDKPFITDRMILTMERKLGI